MAFRLLEKKSSLYWELRELRKYYIEACNINTTTRHFGKKKILNNGIIECLGVSLNPFECFTNSLSEWEKWNFIVEPPIKKLNCKIKSLMEVKIDFLIEIVNLSEPREWSG